MCLLKSDNLEVSAVAPVTSEIIALGNKNPVCSSDNKQLRGAP